jgi:glucose/arabinose dehydrogenase
MGDRRSGRTVTGIRRDWIGSQENLLEKGYGRIREVAEGPDGFIYFSSSNRDGRGSPANDDDRILRLVPVKTTR